MKYIILLLISFNLVACGDLKEERLPQGYEFEQWELDSFKQMCKALGYDMVRLAKGNYYVDGYTSGHCVNKDNPMSWQLF